MPTLFLRPDGRVEGLYDDIIPILDLGPLSVKRASHMEFDNEMQNWAVWIDGRIVGRTLLREDALRWEADVLNMRMQEGQRYGE